jgi:predicted nucleic acid-binding protein
MLVVDTCVLIDVSDDDPRFGAGSTDCLAEHLGEGLTISPVSYVELAPVFDSSRRLLDEFLAGLGIDTSAIFDMADRNAAFSAWARHISQRRASKASRRPVADLLIGALALRHDGLITRNGDDFLTLYPRITIVDPTKPEGELPT